MKRNPTRDVRVGTVILGAAHPIAVQSMCATRTQDIDATVEQAEAIRNAGADLVRVAVDNPKDVEALAEIRRQTTANLVVDLQENYRLAEKVAPYVDKVRYNPGHLYHHEKEKPVAEKVRFLVDVARDARLRAARRRELRLRRPGPQGPPSRATTSRPWWSPRSSTAACSTTSASTATWCRSRTRTRARSSRPTRRFAGARPDVPLHLGVTEAGMPPDGIIKTRVAFEQLLSRGIGDTIRVSLTAPQRAQGRGDHRRPRRSSPTSPPAASAPCPSSTTTS